MCKVRLNYLILCGCVRARACWVCVQIVYCLSNHRCEIFFASDILENVHRKLKHKEMKFISVLSNHNFPSLPNIWHYLFSFVFSRFFFCFLCCSTKIGIQPPLLWHFETFYGKIFFRNIFHIFARISRCVRKYIRQVSRKKSPTHTQPSWFVY